MGSDVGVMILIAICLLILAFLAFAGILCLEGRSVSDRVSDRSFYTFFCIIGSPIMVASIVGSSVLLYQAGEEAGIEEGVRKSLNKEVLVDTLAKTSDNYILKIKITDLNNINGRD